MGTPITSRLLPITHGFTTREGGVSEGRWRSLNLGFSVGDDPQKVEENLRRVIRLAEVRPPALQTISQVHGDRVIEAGPPAEGELLARPVAEADGVWTAHAGAAVGVRTADCVPILIVDPRGKRVAAVHSGWKGTDKRIVARAVEALAAAGSTRSDLLAAIGPSIRLCCYQVSPDLAERFSAQFGPSVVAEENGQQHLDLARAVKLTLRDAGLSEEQIDLLPQCTSCEARLFFSHRRDKGMTGRHLSYAVCRF